MLQYASGSTFITRRTATCDAPLNVPVKRTRPRAKEGARKVLGRQGWQGCKRGQVRGWDGKGRFRTETSTRPVAAGAAGVQGGGAEHLLSFGCIAHNQRPSTKLKVHEMQGWSWQDCKRRQVNDSSEIGDITVRRKIVVISVAIHGHFAVTREMTNTGTANLMMCPSKPTVNTF